MDIPYIGELYSLGAAVTWAFSVILFKKSGESVHPVALNMFKSILAIVLLLPVLFLRSEFLYDSASGADYILLLFSGVIGIAIADSLVFKGLNLLGAGLSSIINCLYSPFIILFSVLFIGESLGCVQVLGVLLIISAVLTATSLKGRGSVNRHDLILGVICCSLAMAIMGISIVMVKPLLDRSPVLWATGVRLVGGAAGLCVHLLIHPKRRAIIKSMICARSWKYTLGGSFLGGYLAMILWVGGMKYTQASTAAALNQTSNIFVFLFAAWFLKERITVLRALAICAAVLGALLVTFG
ncbi:MAG: DMT family transporter [Phycisphaerales bacterium]|nr:DMT family transporter [Phycisphaerales bacterium]